MAKKKTWQSKVYHRTNERNERDQYLQLFVAFCVDCNYCYQACRKRRPKMLLSLHHIIPRSEGGDNSYDNLILLCKECHDKVEDAPDKFRSQYDIEYTFAKRKPKKLRIIPPLAGPDKWQQWVYGGYRNPMKDL